MDAGARDDPRRHHGRPLRAADHDGRARRRGAGRAGPRRRRIVDVHMMIERPERQIAAFAEAGADNITIHAEATPHLHYALQAIHEAGCTRRPRAVPGHAGGGRLGAARGPRRAAVHDREPGLGRPGVPARLDRQDRAAARAARPGRAIEVDGGIDAGTAGPCAAAGATAFVAGTALFGAPDPARRIPARSRRRRALTRQSEVPAALGGYGQPYWSARTGDSQTCERGSPGPYRGRPSVVPRDCTSPPRGRGLRRRRRGRGRCVGADRGRPAPARGGPARRPAARHRRLRRRRPPHRQRRTARS